MTAEFTLLFSRTANHPNALEPLFISWLASFLYRKDSQAFRLVREITERKKSLLWLPALSREQLVSIGEELLKKGDWEQLDWIIDNLKGDPDPYFDNAPDDPEGKFNVHLRTRNGESSRIIHTVRGRLCWLLMQVVTHPRIEEYERVFEIVESYCIGNNLFVRLHATVPLVELTKRRFARIDENTRFLSDGLAERIKKLALRMVEENWEYPVILEWVAHVMVFVRDLDHDSALNIIKRLLTIDESEAAMMLVGS